MKKLSVLLFSLLLVACNSVTDNDILNQFSNTDFYKISEEEALSQAKSFLSDFEVSSRSGSKTAPKKIKSIQPLKSKVVATRANVSSSLPDTMAYIIDFDEDNGFMLVSADRRVEGVLAYVESGDFSSYEEIDNKGFNMFLDGLQKYYAKEIQKANLQTVSTSSSEWVTDSLVMPILNCKWGQFMPYNLYCFTTTGQRAAAGCVAVAFGQIFTAHAYPEEYNDFYYDWDDITTGPSSHSPSGTISIARLLSDIGQLFYMNYGVTESTTTFYSLTDGLDILNYNWERGDYDFSIIKGNLNNGYPVFTSGIAYHNYGHAWVIDGYATRKKYEMQENGNNNCVDSQHLVHCNWGYEGTYDGYFISEAFTMIGRVADDDYENVTPSEYDMFNYSSDLKIYYDIYP